MNNALKLTVELIRECIDTQYKADFDESELSYDMIMQVYKLSALHDVSHLVASALDRRKMLKNDEVGQLFKRSLMIAAYRHEGQAYEIERLSRVLESGHIPFILLKGSELCYQYPEAWMRTRSDIDVLVKLEDLDAAKAALINELSYCEKNTSAHDVSLLSQGGVHVELHYTLWDDDIKRGVAESAARLLEGVWSSALVCDGYEYRYVMDGALFCFYHYVHMAKHILDGGCGIKPFIDINILNSVGMACGKKFIDLAEQGEMARFIECAQRVANVWFGDEQHNDVSLELERFVVGGGVYGAVENRIAVGQSKTKGKMGYILSRVFIPWSELKYHYPILSKHKWLTPLFEVVRWLSLLFGKKKEHTAEVLHANSQISDDQAKKIRLFIKNIGL